MSAGPTYASVGHVPEIVPDPQVGACGPAGAATDVVRLTTGLVDQHGTPIYRIVHRPVGAIGVGR